MYAGYISQTTAWTLFPLEAKEKKRWKELKYVESNSKDI